MGSVHTTKAAQGNYQFNAQQSAFPHRRTEPVGRHGGTPWASFLMGAVNYASLMIPQQPQSRKPSWSLYVQDTWKVTRKLTLDFGLRWDRQTSPVKYTTA